MDVAEFRRALLAADVAPNGNVQGIIRHVYIAFADKVLFIYNFACKIISTIR